MRQRLPGRLGNCREEATVLLAALGFEVRLLAARVHDGGGIGVPTCWWQTTSPDSHFTRSLVCTLATGNGRVTLSDRRLIQTVGGRRDEHTLSTDEEVLAAYRDLFGIRLDRIPQLIRGANTKPNRQAK